MIDDTASLVGLLPSGASVVAVIVMFVLFSRHQKETMVQVQTMLAEAQSAFGKQLESVADANKEGMGRLSAAIDKLADRMDRFSYGGIAVKP